MMRDDHRPCCPIQFEESEQALLQPEAAANHAREPREAVPPLCEMPYVSQQQMRDEACPHLPLHGVLAVADEVVYLAGLLEFPEERLDAPPRPVELRYRPGRPPEVVREKNDLLHLAAYLDERRHPAQRSAVRRVLRRRRLVRRTHQLVGQHLRGMAFRVPLARTLQPLDDIEEHVGLLAHDEEDAASRKVVEEAEVKIRPVRHKNVAVPQLRGACRRPRGVVMRGILDDGERRQPTRELHRHVELRGRFHASVPGPVEAVERELYRAGVEEEYPVAPDPREVSTVLPGAELRIGRLEVREQTPEHVLGHLRVAPGVRVRQRVAVRQLEPGPVPLVRKRLCNVAYPVQRLLPRELHYHHWGTVPMTRVYPPRGTVPTTSRPTPFAFSLHSTHKDLAIVLAKFKRNYETI